MKRICDDDVLWKMIGIKEMPADLKPMEITWKQFLKVSDDHTDDGDAW